MSGQALDWLARIDHLVFQRTRPGAYCVDARGLRGLVWLSLLCLPWPLVVGLFLWGALAIKGSSGGWEAALAVTLALYSARFGHELGHVGLGRPIFYLRGLYASYNLGELRLQMGVRAEWVRAGQMIRMHLGGCVVNLVLGLAAFVAFLTGLLTGTLVLALLGTNVALALGNLLPLRAWNTDGYHAYRIWRASRLPQSCALAKGG